MACKISILTCPIGASGGQCTFEVLCCGGLEDRYSTYVLNEGDIVEACCQDTDLEPAIVVGISGSVYNTSDPCNSYCGDLDPSLPPSPATPAPAPAPAPTPTPAGACQCYQLLYEDAGTATINYTACGGGSSSIVIDPGTFYYICSTTMPTTSDPAVTISAFGNPGGCSQNIDCDPNPPSPSPAVPSPTPATPAPTPTAPSPTPGVPTPTPTPTVSCTFWELTCPSGSGSCSYSYVDCSGTTQTGNIPGDSDLEICVRDGFTPIMNGGTPNNTGVSCTVAPSVPTPVPAVPTPTPAPTAPTPTPTVSCTFWELTCPSGSGSCSYSYVDCSGTTQTGNIPGDQEIEVCVRDGFTPIVNGGNPNNTGVSCTVAPSAPSPSPAPSTPTPTPTGIQCFFWELACGSLGNCSFEYVNCDAVTEQVTLPPDSNLEICVLGFSEPTVLSGQGSTDGPGDDCTVAPSPTPTAPLPSPTPTPAVPNCTTWELVCGSSQTCYYEYINCNGSTISGYIDPDRDIEICVDSRYSPTITNGSADNTTEACGATPVPTSSYSYWEYSKCSDSSIKQVFYAPIGYVMPLALLYNNLCYENPQSTGVSTGENVLNATAYNSCVDCLSANPEPNVCLGFTNTVAIVNRGLGNEYEFNGQNGNPYGTSTGTYTLLSVPSAHPIAILNYGIASFISYTGTVNAGTGTAPDGRTYTYYSGDVTITVNGDYGTVSYACKYHGYMGGQNNLAFNPTLCSIPPAPSPAPAAPSPTPTPASVVPPIPSPVETEYTLTYSQQSQGWPSFYSFIPDYMLGMNQ